MGFCGGGAPSLYVKKGPVIASPAKTESLFKYCIKTQSQSYVNPWTWPLIYTVLLMIR